MQDLMNLIALYKKKIEHETKNLSDPEVTQYPRQVALTKAVIKADQEILEVLNKASRKIIMLTVLGDDLFYSQTKTEFDTALENLKKHLNKSRK